MVPILDAQQGGISVGRDAFAQYGDEGVGLVVVAAPVLDCDGLLGVALDAEFLSGCDPAKYTR